MTRTVVLLSGRTEGDALGSTGRAFREAFEQQGLEFLEVRLAEPAGLEQLNRALQERSIEFIYTFAGIGIDLRGKREDGSEVNIWEATHTPLISLNGDSPAYFFDRHVMPGRMFACLYGFPEHYHLRTRLPERRGASGVVPHVITHPAARSEVDFRSKERGNLVFLKNGNDPAQLPAMWRAALPETTFLMLSELAGELASTLRSDLGNDIDALVVRYFQDRGMDVMEMTKLRLFFIAQLDDYLRRLKSTLIVSSLLDFPIEVHGVNWQHIDFTGKRAKLVPIADFTRSIALIKESLGVIDMSPNTGLAPHDRPMRAFGFYTLCLTNEQEYFRRARPDYGNFSFAFEAESIRNLVSRVLSNRRSAVELGIEVAEAFRPGHTPADFCRYMLDVAGALRLDNLTRPDILQNYFAWPPEKLA